jgi:beta-lactamase class A
VIADKVGDKRLRAGPPHPGEIGDRSAATIPEQRMLSASLGPARAPLLAAVYFTGSNDPMDARNAIHRQVGPRRV